MEGHVQKAWKALAGYKFWMFGYHAAAWVNLKKLHPYKNKLSNPFKALVVQARDFGIVLSNNSKER